MKIIEKKIDEIMPYENNPRKNDNAVEAVANSIREFGFKVPIIIDKNNVIIAGHTRVKAGVRLGMKTVPCIMADDLTDEQVKAFRIADNKTAELADWDYDKLLIELDEIGEVFSGFSDKELETLLHPKDVYTKKTDIPHYEIKGEEPALSELVDRNKYDVLVEEINSSEIDEDIKEFLINSATRHYVFNYAKIAEYYAHANKEVQELMERSALVIIDYDDAIKNGYVVLSESIQEMIDEDDGG